VTIRSLDEQTNRGLDSVQRDIAPWWAAYSRPLRVTFPDMNVQRDIEHGLGVIPDGFLVVYADAEIAAEPGVLWTQDFAYLRAGAVNARAVVVFYTLREEPTDA